MGGTGNIINGLEKLMNEVGIKIIKGHEVKKIMFDNKKITGVKLDNEESINANYIICNADPPAVYENLLNGNKSNSFLFNWKKIEWNTQWDYLFIILELKIYNDIEHHTIKFGNKYKEHLEDIFDNKKLNNDISYYLHRPSATDKSMAPEGHDCFYVLVPVPNNQSLIGKLREKMKNLVIEKMQNDLSQN